MKVSNSHIGKTLKIKDISKNIPCNNCNTCVRLRVMELGMFEGESIKIVDHNSGLWRIQILNRHDIPVSVVALRDDEMNRIIFNDSVCSIELI